jgi:dihydroneopterin aldolase / 2-amino-4-hydroxy-6-hydroxymethyldihydropteridine diphosphokinase / dihydropteroate synthase
VLFTGVRQQENIADCIRINELTLLLPLQSGATWPPPISSNPPAVLQPISISLSIDYDVRKAAYTDDLSQSVDYGALAKELQQYLSSLIFPTLNHVGKSVCEYIIKQHGERFAKFDVKVVKIRGPTQCKHAVVEYSSYRDHGQWKASYVSITLQELRCPTIVGVEPHERLDRQDILVTFTVKNAVEGILVPWPDLRDLVKQIFEVCILAQLLRCKHTDHRRLSITQTVSH